MTPSSAPIPVATRVAALLFLTVAAVGCTATLPVRALSKGESHMTTSLGGPILPNGSPTGIIPYLTVGEVRGLSDNTTLVYDVHLLTAALGVAGVDVGEAHRLHAQSGGTPEITALGQAYLFAGSGGVRVYPHASVNASWRRGDRQLLYVGVDAVAQFQGRPALFGTPLVGWQFPAGKRLALETEFKWMAANRNTAHGIFEGESTVGGHGVLAFQLGAIWGKGR